MVLCRRLAVRTSSGNHRGSAVIVLLLAFIVMIIIHRYSTSLYNDFSDETKYISMVFATAIFGLALWKNLFSSWTQDSTSTQLSVLTIFPALGVQISIEEEGNTINSSSSSSSSNKQLGNPTFLPRDQIVDCLVYEVILSYKVVTVVAFSVQDPNVGSPCLPDSLPTKLIPVFPNTEMTYQECVYMRREILQTLLVGGGGGSSSSDKW